MIEFFSENDFKLKNPDKVRQWITSVIASEGFTLGEITYVFCNDDYLSKLNVEFLDHDTLTDIISFDYTLGKELNGEIYISTERVAQNARTFGISLVEELYRVMVHGVLHYCGYKDKNEPQRLNMRAVEDKYLLKMT